MAPEETFSAIVDHFRFSESPAELRRIFLERWPRLVRPFEGTATGIRQLRSAGWRTALLTNGKAPDQRLKLSDSLLRLFDVACYAEDEDARKPDPAAFRLVADRARAQLSGAWMIGDSLEADIAGGANVGMSTIWISSGRSVPPEGPSPDVSIGTIGEAFPFLLRAIIP